jgi:uncharacterized protein (TIGR02246 family)
MTETRTGPKALLDAGEQALRSVERAWNEAASGWQADRLAALYTDDAVFYGGRPGHSVGREQVRAYFASYVGVLASTRLDLVDQTLLKLGDDTYLAQGYGHFHFDLVQGGKSEAVWRTTLVIVRREGDWKILQHHFSATPEAPPIHQE